VTLKDYYVDIETMGELTAGETVGYSPFAGDLKVTPEAAKKLAETMQIRGAARSLETMSTSPVVREKFTPNAKVAIEVDSARFFHLLMGRLTSK